MSWRPTRAGLGLVGGAVALFVVGTSVQAGWLFVLAALLLGGAAAGALLPLVAVRGVEVVRDAPAAAWAGEPVPVTLRVRNAARGARGLLLLEDRFLGEGRAVVPFLAPGACLELAGVRRGARRGEHAGGPCAVVTGAPIGVAVVRRTLHLPSRTLVYPRLFRASLPPPRGAAGSARDPSAVSRQAPTGEAASVREYRPGDPLRHVHWRSTARAGRLMVREFEDAAEPDVAVVADTGTGDEVLDAVASAACSLALAALEAGRRVHLLPGGGQAASAPAVLGWGARLRPGDGPGVAALLAQQVPEGAAVVCALGTGQDRRDAVRELAALARAGSEVAVVLVGDEQQGRDAAAVLRAEGAAVARLAAGEDRGWRWSGFSRA